MIKKNHEKTALGIAGHAVLASLPLTVALAASIAFSVVLGLLPPAVLGRIVDLISGENAPESRELILIGILYFAAYAFGGLAEGGREVLITVFGQRITHALRTELNKKIGRLPSSMLASGNTGSAVSLITGDVGTVERLFETGIISMAADVFSIVGIWIMICRRNPGLALFLIPAIPFVFFITRLFQKTALKAHSDGRKAAAEAVGILPETLKNIRTVRVFRREGFAEDRFGRAVVAGFNAAERSNFCDAVYSPVIEIMSGCFVAVMMIMASSVSGAAEFFGMSVGTAVAVTAYIGKLFGPIQNIGMEIQNIQSAVAGIGRIDSFLSAEERPERNAAAADMARAASENRNDCHAVEFKNVSFAYDPAVPVVSGFSLFVDRGECVTLAGRTGAGKSTCLKLAQGIYTPAEGSVEVLGRPASEISDLERRKLFGYVEQGFVPVPGTIRDQITLGDPRVTEEHIEAALKISGIDRLTASLPEGLDTSFGKTAFSQGQLQLLSIARAIALDPPVLLLDEITASLDSITEEQVLTAMKSASANRAVLSVSHRLYEKGTAGSRMIFI